MSFTNPFFSLSGQAERIKNFGNVLSIAVNPFSKDKVIANVKDKTLKAGTEFVANNPYTTALIAATGASAAGRSFVTSSVAKLGTGTKVVGGLATIATVPALVSSERLRITAISTAGKLTPEKVAKLGRDTGQIIDHPSTDNLKDYANSNKEILVAGGIAALIAGGSTLAGTIATAQNTRAVKKNTEVAGDTVINVPKGDPPIINITSPPQGMPQVAAISTPNVATTGAVAAPVAPSPITSAKKAPKKRRKAKKKPKKKPKKKKKKKAKPKTSKRKRKVIKRKKSRR